MLESAPHRGNVQGHTCFVTGNGELLTALLLGLTGLHLNAGDPQDWAKHPVVLPDGWDVIEVEKFWARGKPVHLAAQHGTEHAKLESSMS